MTVRFVQHEHAAECDSNRAAASIKAAPPRANIWICCITVSRSANELASWRTWWSRAFDQKVARTGQTVCGLAFHLATTSHRDAAIRGRIWRSCRLSILLYPGSRESNSWTSPSLLSLSLPLPRRREPACTRTKRGCLQNVRSVPFCNSFPARRGHYQTEKRYQTLRNILHSGRRLSSAPPSLPADNWSTSPAPQRPQRGITPAGTTGCTDWHRTAGGGLVQGVF